MNQYKLLSKKGEGTFSEVLKAQSLKHGNFVAIKCMKNHFNSIEQVQRLKEIQALRKVSPHPHVIKLIEVLYDEPTGRLALVFELMDQNLYEAIRGKVSYLNQQKVKLYMYQLLKAIDHMHKKGIFHRDIKPENILLLGDHVKLADFGSCKGVFSEHPYTEYISTRWYRAPECLLTDGYYTSKMDLWGVGCVMFEVMSLFPLFPGNDELDQVHKIHNVLGTPNPKILEGFKEHATHMEFNFPPKKGTGIEKLAPHIPKDCVDLIYKLLSYDPQERITADEALKHPFFKDFYSLDSQDSSQQLLQSTITSKTSKPFPQNSSTNGNMGQSSSTTKLEMSPGQYGSGNGDHGSQLQNSLNSMKIGSLQGSNSNKNLSSTLKYNPYRESAPENVFYPVLNIKKAPNYLKKKTQQQLQQQQQQQQHQLQNSGSGSPLHGSQNLQQSMMKKTIHQQYPSFNLNLKIEGTYNHSGTDDEEGNNRGSKAQFLPPIKVQLQQQQQQAQNLQKSKLNGQSFKMKKPKKNIVTDDYFVQGKKQQAFKQ